MKRIIYIILCTVLAISCSKDTSPENMSESSIKQKLIGKTWQLVKEIDYSVDGKVLDTEKPSDKDFVYEEWEFLDNEHVRCYTQYDPNDDYEIYLNYFIREGNLIIGVAPLKIKKLTNSDLILETQHDTDVESWECSYSELYYRKK